MACLSWSAHRSDRAIGRLDWDSAASARKVAAAVAPFVPGGAVELLPLASLTDETRERVLPETGIVLVSALRAAPYDYRLWRIVPEEGPAAGVAAVATAMTYTGRGLSFVWLEAGSRLLSIGDLDGAVAAFRKGTEQAAPGYQVGRTVCRRLLRYGAPLSAILDACPSTVPDRVALVDELMWRGELVAAAEAARTGVEEFPASTRLASMLADARRRLKAAGTKKGKEP
jgi:hypothetical protein